MHRNDVCIFIKAINTLGFRVMALDLLSPYLTLPEASLVSFFPLNCMFTYMFVCFCIYLYLYLHHLFLFGTLLGSMFESLLESLYQLYVSLFVALLYLYLHLQL